MPERVHRRFGDESEKEPVANGLARYVQELKKQTNTVGPTLGEDKVQQVTVPSEPHGVKRSRSGSPKPVIARLKNPLRPSDEVARPEADGQHNMGKDDQEDKRNAAGENEEPAEMIKEQEKFTVDPKKFYSSSQTHPNSSQSQTSSIGSFASKNTSISGQTSPSSRRFSGGNRAINGGNVYGARKSFVEISESRGSRLSSSSLKRIAESLLRDRKKLPIWAHKADIRWALRHSDVLLLVGETGSGKSTQVPQFLLSEPWFKRQTLKFRDDDGQEKELAVGGRVAITEPRRVAATSLAYRVAAETGSYLGKSQTNDDDKVGYSVRFDSVVPRKSKVKFLTEGMLLQELLHDPYLRRYSAVIVDEIHERSVDVDLLAGFLRNIVLGDKSGRGGIPLKVIVMSATANMGGLQKFFAGDVSVANNLRAEDPTIKGKFENDDHRASLTGNAQASQSFLSAVTEADGVGKVDRRSRANESNIGLKKDPNPQSSGPDDRRSSDASYSSWDGILSENETTATPETSIALIPKAHTNGIDTRQPRKSTGVDNLHPSKVNLGEAMGKDVAIHHIKGRQHPVKVFYTPEPVPDYIEASLKTIFKIHIHEKLPGDILAFLTGQEEIETLKILVEQHAEMLAKTLPKIIVLCLYGHQTNEQQQAAFAAPKSKNTRKVILATNIAETSITVPGVRFVIDCGKAKIKQYRSRLGLQSLLIKPISKSSAIQRKGRAGREAPGQCYRLYTEAEYLKLPDADIPEILRSDVVEAVLRMKARGVKDVLSFPLLDPPDVYAMEKALLTLHSIGALNDDGELSEIGIKMADFPLPAAYSRVLVAAAEPDADCLLEAIDIIACLTDGDDIFLQPKSEEKREEVEDARRDLFRREGDILTYLTAMQKYASENINRSEWCQKRLLSARDMKYAMSVRRQLQDNCVKWNMLAEKPPPDPQPFVPISAERAEILLKCFLKAFAMKTASLQPDGSYCTTVGKHVVAIHPSSVLYGKKVEAIMFLEHVYTQKNYAKKVSAIQMNWIAEALETA